MWEILLQGHILSMGGAALTQTSLLDQAYKICSSANCTWGGSYAVLGFLSIWVHKCCLDAVSEPLINMLWPFGIFNSDACVWIGLQEPIVSTAIAGTALGAALGGQMNDALRRKSLIWMSDLMFSLSGWSHGCGPWTIHLDLWPFLGGIRHGCSIHDCTTL